VLNSAEKASADRGIAASIAVVDESGVLKAFLRMDGAILGSVPLAQEKAYSSAACLAPTAIWRTLVEHDPALEFGLRGITSACPGGGGVPISVEGVTVGALGVSGGTVAQDEEIVEAALASLDL
jgi:glc operon protein GlcG